jgi:hypothetical protein
MRFVGAAGLVPIGWFNEVEGYLSKYSKLKGKDGVFLDQDEWLKIGVRACRPIPKGMFICRYSGEVITEAEAEHRGEEYDKKVSKS